MKNKKMELYERILSANFIFSAGIWVGSSKFEWLSLYAIVSMMLCTFIKVPLCRNTKEHRK